MPEIGMSSSMSGDGKRSDCFRPQATAPILDSTEGIRLSDLEPRFKFTRCGERCRHPARLSIGSHGYWRMVRLILTDLLFTGARCSFSCLSRLTLAGVSAGFSGLSVDG
jgi:hypothetical protein